MATKTYSIDLHSHTTFSDGQLTPEELVAAAKKNAVKYLAITDHDTCSGIPRAKVAGKEHGVEIISGIEISSGGVGEDIHILGFFVDGDKDDFQDMVRWRKEKRRERVLEMGEKLKKLGLDIDAPQIVAEATGNVGRAHVANALVARGYISKFADAFDRYIGRGGPAFIDSPRMSVEEAIALIRNAGGVSSLAHPGTTKVDQQIEKMAEFGLNGIEVFHPSHHPGQIQKYGKLADKLGLCWTGGSDFHYPGGNRDLGCRGIDQRRFDQLLAKRPDA